VALRKDTYEALATFSVQILTIVKCLRGKWRTFSVELKCQTPFSDFKIALGMYPLTLITSTRQWVSGNQLSSSFDRAAESNLLAKDNR
jgi:hypothetical protein